MDLTNESTRIATNETTPLGVTGEATIVSVEDKGTHWRVGIKAETVMEEMDADEFRYNMNPRSKSYGEVEEDEDYEMDQEDIERKAEDMGYVQANTDYYDEGHYYKIDGEPKIFYTTLTKDFGRDEKELRENLQADWTAGPALKWETEPPENWLGIRTDLWAI